MNRTHWILLAVLLLLAALGALIVSRAGLPVQTAPAYHIAESNETADSWHRDVEMPKQSTKSELEEVARALLARAPADRMRLVEFYLDKKGPFTPVYASARLQPGQRVEALNMFYHMH